MSNNISFDMQEIEKNDFGNKYHVSIKVPMSVGWIDDMRIVFEDRGYVFGYKLKHIKNENDYVYFEGDIPLETRAIYRYYFSYYVNGFLNFHKKEDIVEKDTIIRDEMWKMSVNFDTPDWAKGQIMYHIFVDRFNRGSNEEMKEMPRRYIHKSWDEDMVLGPDKDGIWNNDFYGGDLLGIIDKLDYIKSLGVSILYLSPIVHSQSNHRYDTADYENVDPYAGCNEDLKKLCEEAHKRGMKVVLDAVFNHTGNDSKYFNEYGTFDTVGAYRNFSSPYSSFYKKHYVNGNIYYDYWWGMTNLPVCDGYSKEWQEYILGVNGVIDKWFGLGIDGLRLDVADELTDEFIEKIRIAVKRNKEDGFVLGEVWKNPMRMNRGYIDSGKGMDSVMNYPLADALIRYFKYGDVDKLAYIIRDIKNEYPDDTINTLMNFTSTHDISRPIDIFSSDEFSPYSEWAWNPKCGDVDFCRKFKLTTEQYEHGKDIYKAFVFALCFMPGIFSIFYGDEVGVQGLGNLANRKPFPWGKEDKNLLSFFRSITNFRVNEEFLKTANLNVLELNRNYFMFERVKGTDKDLFVVNRTSLDQDFSVPIEYSKGEVSYTLKKSRPGYLAPYGAITIKNNKGTINRKE